MCDTINDVMNIITNNNNNNNNNKPIQCKLCHEIITNQLKSMKLWVCEYGLNQFHPNGKIFCAQCLAINDLKECVIEQNYYGYPPFETLKYYYQYYKQINFQFDSKYDNDNDKDYNPKQDENQLKMDKKLPEGKPNNADKDEIHSDFYIKIE